MKKILATGEETEQKVRSFQNAPALNFPRAALHYLKARPGDVLKFRATKSNIIEVWVASADVPVNDPVAEDADAAEVSEFVSHRAQGRPRRAPTHPTYIRRTRRGIHG